VSEQTAAAPAAEVKTDSTALIAVQAALTEFDKIDAGLTELESKYQNVVYDVRSPAGMASALAARRDIRDPRYRCEQIRKGAKAPVLALGRNIDERARYITGRLEAIETPIDQQIKTEEERREAARKEQERKEQERVATINRAIDAISARPADAVGKGSAEIEGMLSDLEALPIGESFAEQKDRAQFAKDMALSKLRLARYNAAAQEAEAKRLAAEREELVRLRREQEARDRQERERQAAVAAEERARREKLEAEERAARDRIEAEERAARLKREEEDRRVRAEQEAREAEAKRVRDAEEARLRGEREALEAREREARRAQEERERVAREANERAEREARAAAEAEEARKREQERQEQERREAAEREQRRKAAQIADGRQHLQSFVDQYGEIHEFALIAITVKEWLAEGAARPTKAARTRKAV